MSFTVSFNPSLNMGRNQSHAQMQCLTGPLHIPLVQPGGVKCRAPGIYRLIDILGGSSCNFLKTPQFSPPWVWLISIIRSPRSLPIHLLLWLLQPLLLPAEDGYWQGDFVMMNRDYSEPLCCAWGGGLVLADCTGLTCCSLVARCRSTPNLLFP